MGKKKPPAVESSTWPLNSRNCSENYPKTKKNNIANLWKDHFSAIANSVGFTDNRDQVMNALGTVPGHNDVITVHELLQIVRGLKSKKAVGNDGIPSEVYKFASERLLTIMSILIPGVCFLVSYRVSLCIYSNHTATEVQI